MIRDKQPETEEQIIHFLLVEDDEIDAEAVIRAFRHRHPPDRFVHVRDGVEAFYALRGEQGYRRIPYPFVILLDLNLPRMNGLEFLQQLRQDSELRHSIVFILTTSNRAEDVRAAYQEQVAGYILKATAGQNFTNLVDLLDMYWRVIEFPPAWHARPASS
jgi:CheY-like chemotaxis protein